MTVNVSGLFVVGMILFIPTITIMLIFPFPHVEQGLVISSRPYNATSQIGGFASGQTGSGIYYAIQVRTPSGDIFNATVGCNFYPVGSTIPIMAPTLIFGWSLAGSSLQVGCSLSQ